jgi:hypothetical protein
VDRLSQSLFNASVDLNPHQVEAALFALRSPLSKGVLLADEVGLGKTIEAGLVLCQHWAERKRRLLIVCPASLRKQWQVELEDKFNMPATVVDSRVYRNAMKAGSPNPLESQAVNAFILSPTSFSDIKHWDEYGSKDRFTEHNILFMYDDSDRYLDDMFHDILQPQ